MHEEALGLVHLNVCYPKRHLSAATLAGLFPGCSSLEHFEICGWKCTDSNSADTKATPNDAIRRLGQCCPCLKHLDISACAGIEQGSLVTVATGCPQLVGVYLGGCGGVTDEVVRTFDANCPNLKTLFITGTEASADVLHDVRSHVSVHR
eukprot:SAG31_NODE_5414_length_2550_cov_1.906977_3_plen_150_part_00